MNKNTIAAVLLALTVLAGNSLAQEEGAQAMFAYATYFVCSPDGESRADEIISSSFKPHYDAAVEQGDIASWSWLQHFVGGNWRRVLLIIANDMDSLLDASGALGEIISDQTPEAGRAFSAICSSHDDYIWRTVDGVGSAAVTASRGAAGFTAYLECDMSREERADEIVGKVFAPIYDKHVGEGELTTWNWLQHHVGGNWRRILTMGAADHKTLMRTREAIFADFEDRRVKRAAEEFNGICGKHQDYLWDIQLQTP
ncbi:MAG: hypothetical protein GY783_09195 [Gammaproteobacteria bacterium]|nr:hypothetical protein [Gammaproteobacteria bacterium]